MMARRGALRRYAAGGPVDEDPAERYLRYLRSAESNNRNVPNERGSAAYGPYQFMPRTWDEDIAGLEYAGRGMLPSDRYTPKAQEHVMRERRLPGYLRTLRNEYPDRDPDPSEVLALHRLGDAGGLSVLRANASNPDMPVSEALAPHFRNQKQLFNQNPYLGTADAPRTVGGVLQQLRNPGGGDAPGGGTGPATINPGDPMKPITTQSDADEIREIRRMIMQQLPTPEVRAAARRRLEESTARLVNVYETRRADTEGANVPLLAMGAQMMQSRRRGLIPVVGEGISAAARALSGERELDRRDQIAGAEAERTLAQNLDTQEMAEWRAGMTSLNQASQLGRNSEWQIVQGRDGSVMRANRNTGEVQPLQSASVALQSSDFVQADRRVEREMEGLPSNFFNRENAYNGQSGVEARNAYAADLRTRFLNEMIQQRAAVSGGVTGRLPGQVGPTQAVQPTKPVPLPAPPVTAPSTVPLTAPVPTGAGTGAVPPVEIAPPAAARVPTTPDAGERAIPQAAVSPGLAAPAPLPTAPVPAVVAPAAPGPAPVPAVVAPPPARGTVRAPVVGPETVAAQRQLATDLQQMATPVLQASLAATTMEPTLNAANQALNQVTTGPFRESVLNLQRVLVSMGFNERDVNLTGLTSQGEVFRAVSGLLIPIARQGLPGQVSNFEMVLYAQMSPNFSNTVEGNRTLLRFLGRKNELARQQGAVYAANARRNNGVVNIDVVEEVTTMAQGLTERWRQEDEQRQQGNNRWMDERRRRDEERGNRPPNAR